MSDWRPYQTDCLFLLIGTNPLPNYIAALLLGKDEGTAYLLHTPDTGNVASVLERSVHNKRPELQVVPREIDRVDNSRIARKMQEILDTIKPSASIGLNYTGGTKAMAVHTYRTVVRYAMTQSQKVVFSYLDAETLSMRIDGVSGVPTKDIPVEQDCPVTLEELVALHGRVMAPPEREAVFREAYLKLVDVHITDPGVWRTWCQENLRRSDRPDRFKSRTALKAVELPMSNPTLAPIFTSWGSPQTLGDISLPAGWKIDKLAEWLDGQWLEHYVLDCVKEVAEESRVQDYGMSLKPKLGGREFEFDVAAMRGYQLFAISCTTGTKRGMNKQKLFEAYVRARQMGGDEARIGLVCCYPDPAGLKQEIEETWFTEGRVEVFGMQDLPDLPAWLKRWFETANSLKRT